MRCTRPAFIPKMDYSEGVPAECKTVTVVPAILNDEKSALTLLEDLEVYYTANLDENICFALLGDFKDADYPINAEEQTIVNKVEERIEELNIKYGREVFYYLHRKRIFIHDEKKYVGEERKRGALFDFCALLKGEKKEGYLNKEIKYPKDIKYVLTLDADTQVPRDAAKKLIGAMSHPLNKPLLNEKGTRVAKGYALMQPRIGIDVVSAAKSYFSLVFSGQAGLDTYSTAASDLYQDLFGEGIFTGKGIFDLHMYYALLKGAFPKRSILSHDLLEGSYLRTALVSDVVLVDGFPSQYISYTKRQHRWARGDWQLIRRLGKRVLNEHNEYIENPINNLSKYKISDNLNRSLILPACFVVVFLGLTLLYRSMALLLIISLLTLFYEPLSGFIGKNLAFIKNANKGVVFKDAWYETRNMFRQSLFKLSVLPYEAYLNIDAIVRTLYRLCISRKKMLEWVTAAEHENKTQSVQAGYWKRMVISPILGITVILLSAFFVRGIPLAALIIGALWFFAPSIAYFTSMPVRKKHYEADAHTKDKLRLLARKTWRFFDEYCTDETSMWAPDNVQEYPSKKPVDRTSSTNIAFSIISNVIARDFGYITLLEMIERMEKCVAGIEKCEKWHGHMYNWYNTGSLHPLRPEYVSSVDSGNLACYLLAACEGIEDAIYKPIFENCAKGLTDTVSMEIKKNGHNIPFEIQNQPTALSFYKMLVGCRNKNPLSAGVFEGCGKLCKRSRKACTRIFCCSNKYRAKEKVSARRRLKTLFPCLTIIHRANMPTDTMRC